MRKGFVKVFTKKYNAFVIFQSFGIFTAEEKV
jgi:hypothetical protein